MKHIDSTCKCKHIFADHKHDGECFHCECKLFVHIEVAIITKVLAGLRCLYEKTYGYTDKSLTDLLGHCIVDLEKLSQDMEND